MASFQNDAVKAEKADATRRHQRHRIFNLCLRFAVTSVLLCSFFSLLPVVNDMSSVYLSVFDNQLVVFGFINTLVFLIYNFSATYTCTIKNAAVDNSALLDQYLSFSNARRKTLSDVEKEKQSVTSAEPEVVEDKQVVHFKNFANGTEFEENAKVTDMTEEKRYRRTLSENEKKSQRPVLQRSETDIIGTELEVVAAGGGKGRKSIKEMSSEEFRLTIERFIASKKKILREENFAVLMGEEEKQQSFTAITCV